MCTTCMPGANRARKRTLDSWMWNYELLCVTMSVLETESDPLQEQDVLLMIGPSLLSSPLRIFIHFLFTVLFQSPLCIFIHFLSTLCFVIVGQRLSFEFILFYIICQLSQCSPDILVILLRSGGIIPFRSCYTFFLRQSFTAL